MKKQFFTVKGNSHTHRNNLETHVASQLHKYEGLLIESVEDFKTHISATVAAANARYPRCKPTQMSSYVGVSATSVTVYGIGGTIWGVTIHPVEGELTGAYGQAITDRPRQQPGQQLRLL